MWLVDRLTDGAIAAVALAAMVWLGRELISTRLRASVKHEFDEKLARIEADQARDLARLRADLHAEAGATDAVRAVVLAALAGSQSATHEHRVAACEHLWSAVLKIKQADTRLVYFDIGTPEELRHAGPGNKLFEAVASGAWAEETLHALSRDLDQTETVRPFVTPMAWSIFFVYRAFVLRSQHLVARMVSEKKLKPLLEDAALAEFLRQVLDVGEFQQMQGLRIRQLEFALVQMETRLLTEIRRSLSGEAGGEENVRAAATILERATAILGPKAPNASADD